MSQGGLTILDGAQLREADLSLPPATAVITGADVLELAETRASVYIHGVVLPEALRSSALQRLGISNAAAFRATDLDYDNASSTLQNYVFSIADELRDDPVVVAILDGKILNMFLDDEDDFAMLAENLFTDLDTDDRGKINKHEIQNALFHMGVEMGIPPVSEFPQLIDIIKRHGAEAKEELGQAQFAQLLQPVLQEVANNLSKKHVVIVQNIKIVNSSKLRKLLADDNLLNDVVENITRENHELKNKKSSTSRIRCFIEEHREKLGLPSLEISEMVVLFNEVLTEIDCRTDATKYGEDEIVVLLKKILEKFAEKIEANPIFYDLADT